MSSFVLMDTVSIPTMSVIMNMTVMMEVMKSTAVSAYN